MKDSQCRPHELWSHGILFYGCMNWSCDISFMATVLKWTMSVCLLVLLSPFYNMYLYLSFMVRGLRGGSLASCNFMLIFFGVKHGHKICSQSIHFAIIYAPF